jgi:hypothetical protein
MTGAFWSRELTDAVTPIMGRTYEVARGSALGSGDAFYVKALESGTQGHTPLRPERPGRRGRVRYARRRFHRWIRPHHGRLPGDRPAPRANRLSGPHLPGRGLQRRRSRRVCSRPAERVRIGGDERMRPPCRPPRRPTGANEAAGCAYPLASPAGIATACHWRRWVPTYDEIASALTSAEPGGRTARPARRAPLRTGGAPMSIQRQGEGAVSLALRAKREAGT